MSKRMIGKLVDILKKVDVMPLCKAVSADSACSGIRCLECPLNHQDHLDQAIKELEGGEG